MNYFPNEVCIGLQEIPSEISLILPLAGCGHNCEHCHSNHYQDRDNGSNLTTSILDDILIKYQKKVSCICIFSGEHDSETLSLIISFAKLRNYKIALYSGYELSELENLLNDDILSRLNYLKTGRYIKSLGGLESKTTNQKLFKVVDNNYINITKQFWRNND